MKIYEKISTDGTVDITLSNLKIVTTPQVQENPLLFYNEKMLKSVLFYVKLSFEDISFKLDSNKNIIEDTYIEKYPFYQYIIPDSECDYLATWNCNVYIAAYFITEFQDFHRTDYLVISQFRDYNIDKVKLDGRDYSMIECLYSNKIELPAAEDDILDKLLDTFRKTIIDAYTRYDTIKNDDEIKIDDYSIDEFLDDLPSDIENSISLVNLKAFARLLYTESELYQKDSLNLIKYGESLITDTNFLDEVYYSCSATQMKSILHDILKKFENPLRSLKWK